MVLGFGDLVLPAFGRPGLVIGIGIPTRRQTGVLARRPTHSLFKTWVLIKTCRSFIGFAF